MAQADPDSLDAAGWMRRAKTDRLSPPGVGIGIGIAIGVAQAKGRLPRSVSAPKPAAVRGLGPSSRLEVTEIGVDRCGERQCYLGRLEVLQTGVPGRVARVSHPPVRLRGRPKPKPCLCGTTRADAS
ncbi:MAG: hypothetical protein ACFBRM_04640 [Pikeienuella sp.]